ncbi:MAG: toxin-antitoxin system HicB family antitoxin [Propionibacteriales bacterium]|nr:toxin-antitoxin system HicB family antitoxin [Propionibacteriales bacterium]
MDITTYVEGLRQDLTAAAAAGGPDVQAAAERLALALDPAIRMVLLEALSHAAAEISQDLAGGSIDVRLKGREPQFVVTPPPAPIAEPTAPAADEEADTEDTEDGPVSRITLRLPESLKQRAEEAAAKRGQSLNTWLVAAVRMVARERAINVDIDLSGFPIGDGGRGRRGPGQSVSGWVR